MRPSSAFGPTPNGRNVELARKRAAQYSGAVSIAAASAPGEILVPATSRDLARTLAGVAFEDRGEHALKGIAEPVRIFSVREVRQQ